MHALTLLVPAPSVDAVCDRLSDELDALSTSIEDADAGTDAEQPVFDEPGVDRASAWQRARVSALFADEGAATAAAAALAAQGDGLALRVESIAEVREQDWVRLTQAQFGPCEITPELWIVPTWSDVPPHARHVIRLDPGRAFGTGTHPTTRMCLRWIAAHGRVDGEAWRRALDYGCGSGVLAIAARRFGASHVDAVDIDPAAIEATRANALANGVAVDAGAPDAVAGPYQLVVANILAAPLKLLAPLLDALLDAGATLVLSGVLARQADELRAAYAPWLDLVVAAADDGWILLVGERPSGDRMA
ncbi:MAG TPA: 50S ribosomal protein L11 methyltransferase [Caldimonas sp.]|jgi:ribosomal protein L11 methyltransferase|nr:50S ribosomal protein L11 methyltransferase [Caldimonas sp.]